MHSFLLALLLASLVHAASIVDTSGSSNDLVCHGVRPTDCYPEVFVPTSDFHVVHDDQDIPAGLHVRMSLETGRKEARLYDAASGPAPNALAVAPSNTSMEQKPSTDDYGPIREPPIDSPEVMTFAANVAFIKSTAIPQGVLAHLFQRLSYTPEPLITALTALEDSAHDLHWGQRLCQDAALIARLEHWLRDLGADHAIRSASALLLGTAVQNNPAAQGALRGHASLGHLGGSRLIPTVVAALSAPENSHQLHGRLIHLLAGLAQDPEQLPAIVRENALGAIMKAFANASRWRALPDGVCPPEGNDRAASYRLEKRAMLFLLDYLFDVGPRADLSVWLAEHPQGLAEGLGNLCYRLGWRLRRAPRYPCEKSECECLETVELIRSASNALWPILDSIAPERFRRCHRDYRNDREKARLTEPIVGDPSLSTESSRSFHERFKNVSH